MKRMMLALLSAGLLATSDTAEAQSVSYAVSTIDFEAPSQFSFVFATPIVPRVGMASYSFSGFIELIDASDDGVSATPSNVSEFWVLEVRNGATSAVVDIVGGTSILTGPGLFNFSASGAFDCSVIGVCTSMSITFGFLLSGEGDRLISQGNFALAEPTVVPEPGTLALLGFGMAGLAGVGVSRRRVIS